MPSLLIRDDPAQMTIFYGGRVNVYNDVPIEKVKPPVTPTGP